ncbi:3D domain-containing protein [Alkalibacterium thalassium]|uniref:3D (Asp-Asp-Asp) domain-containing protein n=1 Tax=Alkalibacterium thalassium TaxID=426701 RepID=A0A1G8YBV5_9LACT|nr:3D domain-containing protein [Alkalibacterium thalassium]SDK00211.1 3D (Asp-Asp-Asp) domain-containing protein [Alkalibacterium thalassium]
MTKNIVGMVVAVLAFLSLGQATTASAQTLEAIREQQEQTQEEIDSLQKEVNTVLEEVSVLSTELAELDVEIEEKLEEIGQTESEVSAQEEIVEARMEQARQRLQSLQLNKSTQNIVLTILESESLSDLFNRALIIMRLTDAGNHQLELAEEEVQVLITLQEELETAQQELEERRVLAASQKEVFDGKVSELQALIRDNQSQLTELIEREAVEEARIEEARRVAREEAARAAARAEAEQQTEVSVSSSDSSSAQAAEQTASNSSSSKSSSASGSSSSNNSNSDSSSNSSPAPAPAKPEVSSGRTLRVQATGYSTAQPNLSTHTATGIDLRINPRVIAVDPSVIPLGSMVEVEGMGVYIAGDTGGAIRGNIIDIHFQTVGEALSWGRRSVTIRVLD